MHEKHKLLLEEDGSALTMKRSQTKAYALQKILRDRLLNAASSADHWKVAKSLYKFKDPSSMFPVEELKVVFEQRMNPIIPTPAAFHQQKLSLDKALAEAIPECTEDHTHDQMFLRAISDDC